MEVDPIRRAIEVRRRVQRELARHANAVAWSAVIQWVFVAVFGYLIVIAKQNDVAIFCIILLLLSGLAIHAFQAACIARLQVLSRVSSRLDERFAIEAGVPLAALPSISPTAIVWASSVLLLFLQILAPAAWILCRSNHAEACAIALPLLVCALGVYLYVVRTVMSSAARDLHTSTDWIEEVPGPT